jgi:hypothetical protein
LSDDYIIPTLAETFKINPFENKEHTRVIKIIVWQSFSMQAFCALK